ncbi:putative S-adenosylmethionine-dependent methyltransferase/MSMEI_2290 [Rhizobium sp. EC-SD404]|nr:putative S-adenosylmethionine-dependent methyltransferase/MSMEI_2290 [Rhizobium sp. EC-SD404]
MRANRIFETLEALGLASEDSRTVFATATRDRDDLTVYRDSHSGVIYIDGFYVGDETYADGGFKKANTSFFGVPDYERSVLCQRRVETLQPFYVGRRIADFGCGRGDFLRAVRSKAASVTGIELEEGYAQALRDDDIDCFHSLDDIADASLDTLFSFHVLEHLPDPLAILDRMFAKLKPGGQLIAEVPHASEFLLNQLDCHAYRRFTLWSQHLVLHTRHSLARLIGHAGFTEIIVEGVQRYPVSNHLQWLSKGKPGGHKSSLSVIDTPALTAAYADALARIDATDTLIAFAVKP